MLNNFFFLYHLLFFFKVKKNNVWEKSANYDKVVEDRIAINGLMQCRRKNRVMFHCFLQYDGLVFLILSKFKLNKKQIVRDSLTINHEICYNVSQIEPQIEVHPSHHSKPWSRANPTLWTALGFYLNGFFSLPTFAFSAFVFIVSTPHFFTPFRDGHNSQQIALPSASIGLF